MLNIYSQRAAEIASLALYAAFILTCWPKRGSLALAAGLFIAGMFTDIGFIAYSYYIGLATNWGTSDNQSQGFPILGMVLPVAMAIYAMAASILLLPLIPQQKGFFDVCNG